jgi:hypothetical protein
MDEYVKFITIETKSGINLCNENIKLIIYKEDPLLFEMLVFENSSIWSEPLLYAFYNNLVQQLVILLQQFQQE